MSDCSLLYFYLPIFFSRVLKYFFLVCCFISFASFNFGWYISVQMYFTNRPVPEMWCTHYLICNIPMLYK